jgi:anti-sigma factor RsiW
MIRCSDMEVLLSDYADGIADARTRRIVERHVQLCARCRQRVQVDHQFAQQLRRLSLLPPGVSSRVTRFRRRLEAHAQRDRRRLEDYPFFVSAFIATALVVLTLLTLFYFGL